MRCPTLKALRRSARVLCLVSLLTAGAAHADYAGHPRAQALLDTLRDDWQFSPLELKGVERALEEAQQLPQLISAEQNAAERTETWTTYEAKRVDPLRVKRGVEFIRQYRRWLDRAQADYGVPPEVIAGLVGLETNYGTFTGKARVLDALATQGFDHPSRSAFFYSELVEYFVYCRDNHLDPTTLNGSYAGAMGWVQFMPSNIRRIAIDYDGDGSIDLWNPADAIGSAARYLTVYDRGRAWRPGEPIAVPADVEGPVPDALSRNLKRTDTTVGALADAGIHARTPLQGTTAAGLIELPLDQGKAYWIGLHNFYAIMTYNPRVFYAMTVARLADEISRAEAQAQAPTP